MTVTGALYSLFGLGGLSALIWAVISIKDWGRSEYKKKAAQDEARKANENAKTAIGVAQKWADSRGKPAYVRLRELAATKPKHNS